MSNKIVGLVLQWIVVPVISFVCRHGCCGGQVVKVAKGTGVMCEMNFSLCACLEQGLYKSPAPFSWNLFSQNIVSFLSLFSFQNLFHERAKQYSQSKVVGSHASTSLSLWQQPARATNVLLCILSNSRSKKVGLYCSSKTANCVSTLPADPVSSAFHGVALLMNQSACGLWLWSSQGHVSVIVWSSRRVVLSRCHFVAFEIMCLDFAALS